jgi:two-component system, LuxR family, sensor kinase FixL
MSWIVILWSMMAASSLTLAVIHLFVWFRQPGSYSHLLFALLAVSAAVFGGFELVLMQAPTPEVYATTLRWAHVPLSVFVLSMVGFIWFSFGTGSAALALATCVTRLAALALNFTTGANVNFREVTKLDRLSVWGGGWLAIPVGVPNPWVVMPQVSNVLLLLFVVGATVTLWRRGDPIARRRATVVGGSLVLCTGLAAGFAVLIIAGVVQAPTVVMPSVFLVVVAMGYDLVHDVIAAAHLSTQLRASEARFRAVVQAVPTAILLVSERGSIAFANAQVKAVFGYAPDELVGRQVEDLMPSKARGAHESDRRNYMQQAQTRSMGPGRELSGLRKDGTEVPIEVGLNPMQTEDGPLVLVSVVDVSERRRIEQAAARQRDEVAHLSRVGMLGALSGSLAHELNQPLTAILSNAQAAQRFLAQMPPRLDQVAEIIDDIVKSDRRAATVIQRLRALLKKEDAEHRPVDVNEIVQESLRLMRSDLLSRRVEVVADYDTDLPLVSADRVQLSQVMLNFVMNGCEAMDDAKGYRRLLVRTRRAPSGNVEVTVGDRGPGIEPADLEGIFEPFVTTKLRGVGLGLAICRTIVDAHGGRIWATNNPDGGATLHFEIPVPHETTIDAGVRDRIRG